MTSHGNTTDLAGLRARVATLEGIVGGDTAHGKAAPLGIPLGVPLGIPLGVPLGVPEIDRALPWGGLARAGLHEIFGARGNGGDAGAADGFAAILLARLASQPTPNQPTSSQRAIWVRGMDDPDTAPLYLPGLAAFGLDPARLLVVRARNDAEVLWALEEGARSPALAAILGEVRAADFTASRRLQLAAASSGVSVLLRRAYSPAGHGGGDPPASAALTRWRISPAPGGIEPLAGPIADRIGGNIFGPARWRVALMRCRGGRPGEWLLEWDDATGDLAVVTEAGDRQDRQNSERQNAA